MEGRTSSVGRLIGICAVLALASCSGGGGGDGVVPQGTPLLVRIEAEGAPGSLWEFPGVTPPGCATGVPLNGQLLFTFNGRVDPESLPPPGPADGAIRISLPGGVAPAVGSFASADDPAQPPGNGRRVVFAPLSPTDLGDPNSGGYISPATHEVEVRGGASPGPRITIAGEPIAAGAIACFDPCLRPAGAPASTCLVDPVPGSPFITETWPPMGFAPPPPIDANALDAGSSLNPMAATDNTVTLRISEPLLPTDINLGTVKLLNVASLAQVPGQVVFFQAGTAEAGPDTARIDYVASAELPVGTVFELQLDPLVRDFGDHPVEQIQGVPPAQLRFQTQARPFCPQPPHVESFDDDARRAAASQPSVLTWGGGSLQAAYPLEIVGDGSYGPMSFTGPSNVIDTGLPPSPGFSEGVFDATDLTVAPGAMVRVTGPYPLHIRCTGSVSLQGQIEASAGQFNLQPAGGLDQGPGHGLSNNGGGVPGWEIVLGGVGGPGAGAGGRASQGGLQHTLIAENGFGPPIGGQPDPGAAPSATYGGGQGGVAGGLYTVPVHGLGGAGGSAWSAGTLGQPYNWFFPVCGPLLGADRPLAQPTEATLAFLPPVSELSAGSGGGGGGDFILDTPGVPTITDYQGGGGGGGGGGLRISARGPISVSGAPTVLLARGAHGGSGTHLTGGGGGAGSGGLIWLQTFEQLSITNSPAFHVTGGSVPSACGAGRSGAGGDGLIQLEDADGVINTGFFAGGTQAGANVVTLDFPFGSEVVSQVESTFFDTGYGDPRYTAATLASDPTVSLGNAPGASVAIQYQGAHESLTDLATPDLGTLSLPVTGDAIAQLDGYRFVRFRIVISYTAPPASTVNDLYPAVQEIAISYEAPLGCP